MIHEHSRKAYAEEMAKLSERSRRIYNLLREGRSKLTDREIQSALGLPEPNSVRPRITEMIDAGLLEECGSRRCAVTRKTVRIVRAVAEGEAVQLSLL